MIQYTGALAKGLGVLAWDGRTRCEVIVNLVPKDSSVPLTVKRQFFTSEDNQTEIPVELYEGDEVDPTFCERLGACTLGGIERGRAGRPVNVAIRIEVDRTIHMEVEAVGKRNEAIIKFDETKVLASEAVEDHIAFIRALIIRGEGDQ